MIFPPTAATRSGLPALSAGLALLACTAPAPAPAEPPLDAGGEGASDGGAGDDEVARCAALAAEVPGGPVAPGLEAWHEARPRILLETRAAPALFLARPDGPAGERARSLRRQLEETRAQRPFLRRLVRTLRDDRPLLREVALSDGYLFAEDPALARALVAELRLADLFDEEEILVQSGAGWRRLRREGEEYVDAEGRREPLLLGDRLGLPGALPEGTGHMDLGAVRQATGARLVIPVAVEAGRATVRLAWPGGETADALLSIRDGATEVTCVAAPRERVQRLSTEAAGYWEWVAGLTDAAGRMVAERPGFDEPRDEPEGVQEDGELRQAWKRAYYRGERTFLYREEEYPVFDRRGNPVPPQVCIDFIFDTFERAAGTWYVRRGARPRREAGYLDLEALPGLLRRQTPAVLSFASEESTPLSRWDVPRGDQIPFRRRGGFAAAIAAHAERFREGDVLVIHGLRDEDQEEHYHTALVLETDPLTGFPTLLADNAGRPRIRTLAQVMASAPRRAIKHRLRLDLSWLLERRRCGPGIDGGRGLGSTLPR